MNISDEEIEQMLPGYEVMDQGFGYYYDGQDGRRRKVTGGTPRDQVFAKESLGYVNVSMAWELLDRTRQPTQLIALDQGVKDSIALIDINPEHVRKVSSAALKRPILMGVGTDGMHVLDGHHRLTKLIWNNRKNFEALILAPEGISLLQVRTWKADGDDWELEYGIDEEEAKRRLSITRSRWNPKNIVRKVQPV